ncbi:MAG: winged helix-turn-helix domain-containing protein [Bacteroidales bacterium]|nr:winged helix-turn-helix domain-containing protein [Bacteroidales bacterium]
MGRKWEESGKNLERKIIEAMHQNPYLTLLDLHELTGFSKNGLWKMLNKMKERGDIKRVGPDRGGYWEVINK